MYSCDFLLVSHVVLVWYFCAFFLGPFCLRTIFCFCSCETILWATKWTCLLRRWVTLACFIVSFKWRGRWMKFQSFSSIIFTWKAFSPSCAAVHCGYGSTPPLPYHELPYSSISKSPCVIDLQIAADTDCTVFKMCCIFWCLCYRYHVCCRWTLDHHWRFLVLLLSQCQSQRLNLNPFVTLFIWILPPNTQFVKHWLLCGVFSFYVEPRGKLLETLWHVIKVVSIMCLNQ